MNLNSFLKYHSVFYIRRPHTITHGRAPVTKQQNGFTLIEIIITLMLIAVTGTALFQFMNTTIPFSGAPANWVRQEAMTYQEKEYALWTPHGKQACCYFGPVSPLMQLIYYKDHDRFCIGSKRQRYDGNRFRPERTKHRFCWCYGITPKKACSQKWRTASQRQFHQGA